MSTDSPSATRWQLALAFVLSLCAAIPFLNKPVHQDDWAYLRVAELLRQAPDDILQETTIYQGGIISAGEGILHGPFWIHTLALCLGMGANGIYWAHWVTALCLALLGLSMASLAGRLGLPPLAVALLVVLSPVPLVLAGNLMTDLPMLAFFAAALALGLRWLERDSMWALIGAGLLGAIAALIRYHGLAVVPMLLALPLAWPRARFALRGDVQARLKLKHFVPFVLSFVFVAGFLLRTMILKGQADAGRAVNALDALEGIDRTACWLAAAAAMGGTLLSMSLGWLAAPRKLVQVFRERGGLVALGLGLGLGITACVVAESRHATHPIGLNLALQRTLLVLFGIGLMLAMRSLWQGQQRVLPEGLRGFARWRENHGEFLFLMFWLIGYLVAAWMTVPFGSTRYALPAMPAVVLFAALFAKRHLGQRTLWAAVLPMGLIGMGSAVADLRAAEVYPRFAQEMAEIKAADPTIGDLWIWGELDFRWYLEEEPGLQSANQGRPPQILPVTSNAPKAGDRVFKSAVCTAGSDGLSGAYRLNPLLVQRMKSEGIRVYEDDWPIRVHDSYVSAGFYGAKGGILPFAFAHAAPAEVLGLEGTVPLDRIQSYKIDDANFFLSNFHLAQIETTTEKSLPSGNIHVEPFLVSHGVELGIEQKPAILIVFPGRATYPDIAVPANAQTLELFVAENDRTAYVDGPGGIVRVRINGSVKWEATIDSRRNAEERKWFPVSIDLTEYQGQSIAIAFEVEVGPWPGAPAVLPSPPLTCFGFAEPVIR